MLKSKNISKNQPQTQVPIVPMSPMSPVSPVSPVSLVAIASPSTKADSSLTLGAKDLGSFDLDCQKVRTILLREKRFVSLSEIQLWAGLTYEDAVPVLRTLFQSGILDHIPGNGTGNSRYKIKAKETTELKSVAVRVDPPKNSDRSDLHQNKPLVISNPPEILMPVKIGQAKQSNKNPKPFKLAEETINSAIKNIDKSSQKIIIKVKDAPKNKRVKNSVVVSDVDSVDSMASKIQKIRPPAWINPFPEPLSIEGIGSVKNRFVFHFSRRPGGVNIAMNSKHAKFIANCILSDSPPFKALTPISQAKEIGCEKVTSIHGLTIVRLTRRPSGNCMIMKKSQARDLAMQILALR